MPSRRSLDVEQHPMLDTYLKYHLPFYQKLYQRRLVVLGNSGMTGEGASPPTRLPPDCDTPSLRHQGPIWPQGNEQRRRCLVNVHANRPLTPPLR